MTSPVDYEVRVAGVVGPAAREAFAGLDIQVEQSSTLLRGRLDQSALHGLIERVEALGLELIDLRRLPESEPALGAAAVDDAAAHHLVDPE